MADISTLNHHDQALVLKWRKAIRSRLVLES
jgi:hypothetical protein